MPAVFTFPCICLIVGAQAIKVKASADTELNPGAPPLLVLGLKKLQWCLG